VDIRAKVLTALRWAVAARFAGQLIAWASTIVVIRMLSPEDYGLMAMATVVVSFCIHLNTLGLDAVLVQNRSLDQNARQKIFGAVIMANLVFFALMLAAAPWIAGFYGESRLTEIIQVLTIQFILLIFETLPMAQLEREMNFRDRSIVDLATLLAGSIITLVLAFMGLGVWALVWGNIATTAARIVGLNLIEQCLCWPSFSLKAMKSHLSFGGYVTMDRGLHFIFAEADKFIGGKLLGKELLGYYAVGSHLAYLPIQKLSALINSVAFPAFSQVQTDPAKVGEYMLKVCRMMSIVAFPVFFGMSSVAHELVALLLGEKWQAAALPLLIITLVMPLRMLYNLFQPLLWGVGRPDVSATNLFIAALGMPVAFMIGGMWGLVGISLAWVAAYPVIFIISIARALPQVGLHTRDLLRTIARPAFAGIVMYAGVLLAKPYVVDAVGGIFSLILLVLIGCGIYLGLVFSLNREGWREMREMLKG
jgi:O-antigen/teichoic acid export membrane protein